MQKTCPIVLLHAFPLSLEMWRRTADALREIFPVILMGLPGLGNTNRLAQPSISAMAVEIFHSLEKRRIEEPVFLAGLSMGGYVAFEFFRQYPHKVTGLGFFSTRAQADSAETREKRMQGIEKIKKEGLAAFLEGILPKLLGQTTLREKPEILAEVKDYASRNSPEGVIDALLAIASRRDSTEMLKSISCPVLIAAGKEDQVISSDDAALLQRQIPHSELHVIEKAGHLLNLEAPDEFESIFLRFLTHHFQS